MACDRVGARVLVGIDSYAGRTWYAATLLRATRTRAQVRWDGPTAHLDEGRGRWVFPGDVSWVPQGAVRDTAFLSVPAVDKEVRNGE